MRCFECFLFLFVFLDNRLRLELLRLILIELNYLRIWINNDILVYSKGMCVNV